MKINLDFVFTTLDGKPLKVDDVEFTMKKACVNALMMGSPNENIDGMEKVKRATLAETIFKTESVIDLGIDDIAKLKATIGVMGSPLIVKQAWEILDPKTKN